MLVQAQVCIDALQEKLEKLLAAVFSYGQKTKFLGKIWAFFVKLRIETLTNLIVSGCNISGAFFSPV